MAVRKDYKLLNKNPFDTKIRNFTSVFKYFMYYAPNIDSCQSVGRIENSDDILNDMLRNANMKRKSKFLAKIQPSSWRNYGFESDILDFEEPKMLCHKMKNESQLTALLRHIRNALAHGYLYVCNKKGNRNYILLVDYDSGRNKCTAKILVSMQILETWKAILENVVATGE